LFLIATGNTETIRQDSQKDHLSISASANARDELIAKRATGLLEIFQHGIQVVDLYGDSVPTARTLLCPVGHCLTTATSPVGSANVEVHGNTRSIRKLEAQIRRVTEGITVCTHTKTTVSGSS